MVIQSPPDSADRQAQTQLKRGNTLNATRRAINPCIHFNQDSAEGTKQTTPKTFQEDASAKTACEKLTIVTN